MEYNYTAYTNSKTGRETQEVEVGGGEMEREMEKMPTTTRGTDEAEGEEEKMMMKMMAK